MTGRLEHSDTGSSTPSIGCTRLPGERERSRHPSISCAQVYHVQNNIGSESFPTICIWNTITANSTSVPGFQIYLSKKAFEQCQFVNGARQANSGDYANTRFT